MTTVFLKLSFLYLYFTEGMVEKKIKMDIWRELKCQKEKAPFKSYYSKNAATTKGEGESKVRSIPSTSTSTTRMRRKRSVDRVRQILPSQVAKRAEVVSSQLNEPDTQRVLLGEGKVSGPEQEQKQVLTTLPRLQKRQNPANRRTTQKPYEMDFLL